MPSRNKAVLFKRKIVACPELCASLAQLDRATGFEPVGRGFESLRAQSFFPPEKSGESNGS